MSTGRSGQPPALRVCIRVHPGSSRDHVGGRYGTAEPPTLIVRVRERPVRGRATDAALRALAEAFAVPAAAVRLCHGGASRTKHVEIRGGSTVRLVQLLTRAAPEQGA